MSKDYYKTLAINKDATPDEVKRAYRKLAKEYHPDINKAADAEKKFKEINEAYQVLSDEKSRKTYDQFGSEAFKYNQQGQGNPFGAGGGFSFDFGDLKDIFSSFGGFGGAGFDGRRQQSVSADMQTKIEITFLESMYGTSKTLRIKKSTECSHCHGSGAETPSDVQVCPTCHGSGKIVKQTRSPFGVIQHESICPTCHGVGKIISKKCHVCGGSGKESIVTNIKIDIPAGIHSNQRIRLQGKGGYDSRLRRYGDLYINVFVYGHPFFKREDDDLILEVPVYYADVINGTSIVVPTLWGDVKMKIPPGTHEKQIFKIKNKGAPVINKKNRYGDLYVIVEIIVPNKADISFAEQEKIDEIQSVHRSRTTKEYINKVKDTIIEN
ncbi:molecular chaperone DnaJ [Mycoplasma sp. SG1]|uniref:molecular chaperone DnaJ n=1 Tax=Mycoplasma sp. SG1 TaxID=2810348 RepID=UPI002024D569|nr:molecular chaperone DnaJ [Mycoplasma sp. SG1]URM52790.1 molecular chaperone DnaJ [Mycoplasma sp. SG1]